jgi:hypothetical protein
MVVDRSLREGSSMETAVTAIRLPRDMVRQLRVLAHQRSIDEGIELTWSSLVREMLQRALARYETTKSTADHASGFNSGT